MSRDTIADKVSAIGVEAGHHIEDGRAIMEALIDLLEESSPKHVGNDADKAMDWKMRVNSRIKQANVWIRG